MRPTHVWMLARSWRVWLVCALLNAPCPVEAGDEHRESPPEWVPVEELERRAREKGDLEPVGSWFTGQGGLVPQATLSWTELGPQPILDEYWSGQANASGRVSAILVHPTNPSVVYIGAAQGGVWKTTDGGGSWTPLTDQLSSLASGALAFDPANPDILYYATGEQHYSGDSFAGDGLFRTNDAGATWTKIAAKASVGSFIARVLVNPSDANDLVVASDMGVVRSTDGSTNWTVTLSGDWCNDLVRDPSDANTLYAAIYGVGVHKSIDGGATWTLLGGGLPADGFARINLAIAPSNGQVLYASFVDEDPFGSLFGMYKTNDGGASWTLLSATPNYLYPQGWYDNCLVVDPSNPDVCYAGGVFPYNASYRGVIATANGGASWTDITIATNGTQVHPDQHFMTFGPDGKLWLANDGGIWNTSNPGTLWNNRNTNLAITQFYEIGLHPWDADQILGGTQDNGTLIYAGSTAWPQLIAGDGGPCGYEWDSPSIFYSTYIRMWYLYRWNAGAFDGNVTGPWQGLGDRASFAEGALTFDPNAPNTFLVGTYRVWRTGDSGASWTLLSGDLTGGTGSLRAIAVATGASNTIYAASSDGRVHYTTDAITWEPRSTGLPTAPLADIVVDPTDPLTAYTCAVRISGERVFKTTDAGLSWVDITGDLPANQSARSLAIDFRWSPRRLYLGTDLGVYLSQNGGANWTDESAGLPNSAVYDLGLDTANDHLVAATHGRGMWRAPVPTPVAVAFAASTATATLEVEPNPFGPGPVTLRYSLPQGADQLRVTALDVAGRVVRTLFRGRSTGRGALHWDGEDEDRRPLSAGIYFLRLEAPGFQLTRRVVRMK